MRHSYSFIRYISKALSLAAIILLVSCPDPFDGADDALRDLDHPLPEVETLSEALDDFYDTRPTWTWTLDPDEPSEVFRYRINGGDWRFLTGMTSYSPADDNADLFPGTYRFEVQQRNSAGNWSRVCSHTTAILVRPPGFVAIPPDPTDERNPGFTWEQGRDGGDLVQFGALGLYSYRLERHHSGAWTIVSGEGADDVADTAYAVVKTLADGRYRFGVAERNQGGARSAYHYRYFEVRELPAFVMHHVPVLPGGIEFPTGWNDAEVISVADAFHVAETLVTWELWNAVYEWATHVDRGAARYVFANRGRQGGDMASWTMEGSGNESGDYPIGNSQHPATKMSFLDTMVWCNALTEWHNMYFGTVYDPVYRMIGDFAPVRDADPADTQSYILDMEWDENADGFRLLRGTEWELAAKWRTDDTNTVVGFSDPWFTVGGSGSDAIAPVDFADPWATNEVAWWMQNDGGENSTTKAVGQLRANSLGLYDMTGNVEEFCLNIAGTDEIGPSVRLKGWFNGDDVSLYDAGTFGADNLNPAPRSHVGFRFGRNVN